MWRNFRNVGSAMQALGNVVAPPVEDDDEDASYYDDDEEEEELEEADDINSQENDELMQSNQEMPISGERTSSPLKTGFGFVGMIARALDRHEDDEDDDGSYEEYEDDEGEEVVELYADELPSQTQQQISPLPPTETAETEIPLPDPSSSQLPGTTTPPRPPEDDGWDDVHTTWATNETTDALKNEATASKNGGKMQQRRSIQRETGSLSPIVSSKKSLQSSPMTTPTKNVEPSTTSIVDNLQSKLPDLLMDPDSNELVAEPSEELNQPADSEAGADSREIDEEGEIITKSQKELPETDAPPPETAAPARASSAASTDSSKPGGRERRGSYKFEPEGTIQPRRSSKVSLSDARFLAEPPRVEELESADRWGAPKSESMKNKARTSKDNHASRHSLDSYFDDSSLSSVSGHNRLGQRKDSRKQTVATPKAEKNAMHLSVSSPALLDTEDEVFEAKGKAPTKEADDRFRAEPPRTPPQELPTRDTRFASTRSHAALPPEPQRQASRRQWSNGSVKNKAESAKTGIVEKGRNAADFDSVVTEGTGSVDPPRNPRRKGSGDETPLVPEVEPRMGRRPPLVSGNSRDGDVLPRRPVQRMHSLTEENTNTEESGNDEPVAETTTTANGVDTKSADENNRLDELRSRCMDLEKQLKEALDAKDLYAQKLKQEESAREAQVVAFREKEARFFDASAEAQEQMMRELNTEMERRVAEVSSLLEDQQRQHELERAEWQEMLKDAEDQLQAAKGDDGIADQMSSLVEDQQRRHESERAEWQELLTQAEEQIEALKQSQANGSSDISERVSSLMEDQQRQHEEDRAEWQEHLSQVEEQLEAAQKEKLEILAKLESTNTQNQQRQDRALRIAEDKLAQTLAILDEREEQIVQLKTMVKSMSEEVHEHREGVQEVEDEADELRHQNEILQHRLETAETKCSELQVELRRLRGEADKMGTLKMELRLLKEDRQRERAKSQSVAENASSNSAKLANERDAALAEVSSLRQQLAAAQADTEIAQQDAARAQRASENLQMALESIQGEREAELSLLEEQKRAMEESTAAAHAAALEATHEANEARVREVRAEAQIEVLAAKAEIKKLEEKLESFRAENVQMRRSLDEAISRLQHNQEDVIDRTLMKNILLDWLTKTGSKEKRQILELMASVLHFTDEEKGRVHIGGEDFSLGKVVATVAPTPPPPKADVEHLQGSNVREKWVNFLLAETED